MIPHYITPQPHYNHTTTTIPHTSDFFDFIYIYKKQKIPIHN
jgi:hypothetical protein